MEPSNNSLNWMTFSGLAEECPFLCLCTNHAPLRNPQTADLPARPAPLREDANDAQRRGSEAQTQARATSVQNESHKSKIWR